MLDTEGNIWYWGNKNSVGIKDLEHPHQKHPEILFNSQDLGPFISISSCHERNLAVNTKGEIFLFGADDRKIDLKIGRGNQNQYTMVAISG